MDENKERYNIERYGKRDSGNAVRCTKSKSKKNYSHNVMFVGNKTDLQVQSAVDKKIFYIPKYLLELYSSSKATARNSKNIVIEMDPPASLSVIITASSLISGYRSINGYVNFS